MLHYPGSSTVLLVIVFNTGGLLLLMLLALALATPRSVISRPPSTNSLAT